MLLPNLSWQFLASVYRVISFFGHYFEDHTMENEHLPSDASSSKPEKPPRSKLERAIVWTLIGVLLIFVGVEALAKTGYDKTVKDLQTTIDTAEAPLTLNDFQSKVKSGLAVQGTGEHDGIPTVLFTWPSLVKKYQIHFTVNGDAEQTLATFATGTDPAESIRYRTKGEDIPVDFGMPAGEGGPASHMETGAEAGESGPGGNDPSGEGTSQGDEQKAPGGVDE